MEPNQRSNEIQAWTETFEQKNNDRIFKKGGRNGKQIRRDFERNKSNKSTSTVTNPWSEIIDKQNIQPSGSKIGKSIGVHASYNEIELNNRKFNLNKRENSELLGHTKKPFNQRHVKLIKVKLK